MMNVPDCRDDWLTQDDGRLRAFSRTHRVGPLLCAGMSSYIDYRAASISASNPLGWNGRGNAGTVPCLLDCAKHRHL